jgi:ubiquinone/menaquinone biosynthesis C-methylase UbiE
MGDPGHVRTFDRIAPVYDAKFGKDCTAAHTAVLRQARDLALEPRSVLDIGCGTGALLEQAKRQWPSAALLGVDPAHGMLEVASGRLPGADVRLGTAEELPWADASVDLVLSTTSFGHWGDQQAGLREAGRVLRPDGTILLAEHDKPGLLMTLLLTALRRMPRLHSASQLQALVGEVELRCLRLNRVEGGFLLLELRHAKEPST